jgi:SAM-dependent methyltransferase
VIRRLGDVELLDQRLDWLHRASVARIDALEGELRTLRAQIEDAPYVSDTSALRVITEDGRERLGFEASATPAASFYEQFEELFRGPEDLIRDRLKAYVPLLADRAPVVDVGCGRGEMLDLLAAAGIDAWGVELDAAVASNPIRKGHRIEVADACSVLRTLAPSSVGAVFSSQFVEHLSSGEVAELVDAAKRALRPGGLFIAETVNPHAIAAFRTFWLDPTHVRPIFPEALLLLCRAAGFARGYVMYPMERGDPEADRTASGEYAVIAEV